MQVSRRLLWEAEHVPPAPSLEPAAADSDIVVILAALLCALICVVGLALVARCAWLRRSAHGGPAAPPKKGVKKKVLRSLPKLSFHSGFTDPKFADCAICLAEFADGDEIRVLPQCGHGFHVACVDVWLASHSSCPSCRQVLLGPSAPPRCQNCGTAPAPAPAAAPTACAPTAAPPPEAPAPARPAPQEHQASGSKSREDDGGHRYLP
ncbi:unnamed protein product [Spirodela intermedia]|uniref:RING-type domain-containing protein n=1 Tax=Spirodela intermedia TaxID=51605 RepID=A0A7I8K2H7_SPIIN|nr:unnamed protein product [Spirodela intermedia]